MKRFLRGPLGTALKVLVSGGLLALLVASVDWVQLADEMPRLRAGFLAAAFACFVAQFPISCWKWKRSLEIHRIQRPAGYLMRVMCTGFFFNNFLPSSIGGDGYRVFRTLPVDGLKSRALSSVLLERILGFGALIAIGLAAGLWLLAVEPSRVVAAFVGLAGGGGVAVLAAGFALRSGLLRRLRERLGQVEKLQVIAKNFALIRSDPQRLAAVIGISILFQSVAVLATWLLFQAVGHPAPFAKCAVVGAISTLVAVLPISINGIGVLEGSFVLAAVELGIEREPAVLVALVTRLAVVVLSAACGVVWILGRSGDQEALAGPSTPGGSTA